MHAFKLPKKKTTPNPHTRAFPSTRHTCTHLFARQLTLAAISNCRPGPRKVVTCTDLDIAWTPKTTTERQSQKKSSKPQNSKSKGPPKPSQRLSRWRAFPGPSGQRALTKLRPKWTPKQMQTCVVGALLNGKPWHCPTHSPIRLRLGHRIRHTTLACVGQCDGVQLLTPNITATRHIRNECRIMARKVVLQPFIFHIALVICRHNAN